jgi:hypothetical protein
VTVNALALPRSPTGERGSVLRTLKDGYWDRTEIVHMPDGSLRVRKSSKGDAPPGPWGVAALRREIAYLSTLAEPAQPIFPPLLAAWDDQGSPPLVGYEVPFYAGHSDAGELARRASLSQAQIDEFQDCLAEALLDHLHPSEHAPLEGSEPPLSEHVRQVVAHALGALESDPALAALIRADFVQLNQRHVAGPAAAFARIQSDGEVLGLLDSEPQVRLHGDFFLENILWQLDALPESTAPRLVLIDPVSVAGVMRGPPLFDLVKYVSYAKGELPALRSEWVDIAGFNDEERGYACQIRYHAPELAPFSARDWHSRLTRAFEAKYGSTPARLYALIDAYFSLAMAVNTQGVQRRARLLKATADLNAVLGNLEQ